MTGSRRFFVGEVPEADGDSRAARGLDRVVSFRRLAAARLREPMPTTDALKAYTDLEDATRVPYYLFFDLVA